MGSTPPLKKRRTNDGNKENTQVTVTTVAKQKVVPTRQRASERERLTQALAENVSPTHSQLAEEVSASQSPSTLCDDFPPTSPAVPEGQRNLDPSSASETGPAPSGDDDDARHLRPGDDEEAGSNPQGPTTNEDTTDDSDILDIIHGSEDVATPAPGSSAVALGSEGSTVESGSVSDLGSTESNSSVATPSLILDRFYLDNISGETECDALISRIHCHIIEHKMYPEQPAHHVYCPLEIRERPMFADGGTVCPSSTKDVRATGPSGEVVELLGLRAHIADHHGFRYTVKGIKTSYKLVCCEKRVEETDLLMHDALRHAGGSGSSDVFGQVMSFGQAQKEEGQNRLLVRYGLL